MAFPIKVCSVCSEEFELKPDKPGFANRCPECSAQESVEPATKRTADAVERKAEREANEARREAMRNLLYRKDS
jgi:DNA-directed RNA polymerase subunit RPC12/RpoP